MNIISLVVFLSRMWTGAPETDQAKQIDLLSIAEISFEEVEKVLGKSSRQEIFRSRDSNCMCNRFYFREDKISITFIDGKSDWIEVYTPLQLINVDKAHVMQFHKWKDHVFVKLRKTRNDDCCLKE